MEIIGRTKEAFILRYEDWTNNRSPEKQHFARKSQQNERRTFGGSIGRPTNNIPPESPNRMKRELSDDLSVA